MSVLPPTSAPVLQLWSASPTLTIKKTSILTMRQRGRHDWDGEVLLSESHRPAVLYLSKIKTTWIHHADIDKPRHAHHNHTRRFTSDICIDGLHRQTNMKDDSLADANKHEDTDEITLSVESNRCKLDKKYLFCSVLWENFAWKPCNSQLCVHLCVYVCVQAVQIHELVILL